jgi:hypothetical protein
LPILTARLQRSQIFSLFGRLREFGENLDCVEPHQPDPERAFLSVPPSLRPWFLQMRGINVGGRGRLNEGLLFSDLAIQLATEGQQVEVLSQAYAMRATLHRDAGDAARQLEDARRGHEFGLESGSNFGRGPGAGIMATALAENGFHEEALEVIEAALRHFAPWGDRVFLGVHLASLALAQLAAGEGTAACKTGREAVAASARMHARSYGIDAGLSCARALIGHEGLAAADEIRELLRATIATAQQIEFRARIPLLLEERANFERLTEGPSSDAALASLREAHALSVEIGADLRAERLASEIAASSA